MSRIHSQCEAASRGVDLCLNTESQVLIEHSVRLCDRGALAIAIHLWLSSGVSSSDAEDIASNQNLFDPSQDGYYQRSVMLVKQSATVSMRTVSFVISTYAKGGHEVKLRMVGDEAESRCHSACGIKPAKPLPIRLTGCLFPVPRLLVGAPTWQDRVQNLDQPKAL